MDLSDVIIFSRCDYIVYLRSDWNSIGLMGNCVRKEGIKCVLNGI